MSEWKTKRFWKETTTQTVEGGFAITLDGRAVKTPSKSPLVVPSHALALAIAAEWDAQQEKIDPTTMPFTRAANSAIDKVGTQKAEVADMLAAYGDADLTCYRASSPRELAERQAAEWDPLLDWAAEKLGARLVPVAGLIHQPQNPDALAALSQQVHQMDAFSLAGFHDLVCISGSLIIGFAAVHDYLDAPALWRLSRVDELWQEEQWGEDEEATAFAKSKESDFVNAKRFHDLALGVDKTTTV